MDALACETRRSHLLIAGTGRAGTSFLVRYLTGLGLDTTLSRQGDAAFWDEHANAGLEENENVARGDWQALPYVVKTPWLHELIDEVLVRPDLHIDAVVVPMRDLAEAASSRVTLELRAMYQSAPWMSELQDGWDAWGTTPGGVLYSLNPVDQARLLAVGLHRLLERLARAAIPVVLMGFPRLVQDADYVFRLLQPCLPPGTTVARARDVHRGIADAAKVRLRAELAEPPSDAASGAAPYPERERLHRIALGRELARVSQETAAARTSADAALATAEHREALARERATVAEAALQAAKHGEAVAGERAVAADLALEAARLREAAACGRAAATREALEAAVRSQAAAVERAAAAEAARDAAMRRADDAEAVAAGRLREADAERTKVAALRQSRSWRLTAPMRRLSAALAGVPAGQRGRVGR